MNITALKGDTITVLESPETNSIVIDIAGEENCAGAVLDDDQAEALGSLLIRSVRRLRICQTEKEADKPAPVVRDDYALTKEIEKHYEQTYNLFRYLDDRPILREKLAKARIYFCDLLDDLEKEEKLATSADDEEE